MKILSVLAAVMLAATFARGDITFAANDGSAEVTWLIDGDGMLRGFKVVTNAVPNFALDVMPNDDAARRAIVDERVAYRVARDQWELEYIVFKRSEWERLTNTVEKLRVVAERRWNAEHATAAGRRAWHGNPIRRMSADGTAVLWEYPDGYKYEEKVPPSRPAHRQITKNAQRSTPNPNQYKHLPPRLRAKRLAQDAQGKATDVNATFGPGGKVLKVEESK